MDASVRGQRACIDAGVNWLIVTFAEEQLYWFGMLFARMSPGVEVTRACVDVAEWSLFLYPPMCQLDHVDVGTPADRHPGSHTVGKRVSARRAVTALARSRSRYTRHLAHVACLGKSVHLMVLVRRFWCRHPDCPRRIFAERLGPLAEVYARRTTRLL